jgi:hypothetical protein
MNSLIEAIARLGALLIVYERSTCCENHYIRSDDLHSQAPGIHGTTSVMHSWEMGIDDESNVF